MSRSGTKSIIESASGDILLSSDDDESDMSDASIIDDLDDGETFISIHLKQLELVRKLGVESRGLLQNMITQHQRKDAVEVKELDALNTGLYRQAEHSKLSLDIIASVVNATERERLKKMLQTDMARTERDINQNLNAMRLKLASELFNRQKERNKDMYSTLARGYNVISDFGAYVSRSGRSALLYNRGALMSRLEGSVTPKRRPVVENLGIYLNRNDRSPNIRVTLDHLGGSYRPVEGLDWGFVRATDGPWILNDPSKNVARELVAGLLPDVERRTADNCLRALARVLDVTHPGHRLYSDVVANPTAALSLLSAHIESLLYRLDPEIGSSLASISSSSIPAAVKCILEQISARVGRSRGFYMEVTLPPPFTADWVVGLVGDGSVITDHAGLTGQGMAVLSDGTLMSDMGTVELPGGSSLRTTKILGLFIDQLDFSVRLYADGRDMGVVFGTGAGVWPEDVAAKQLHSLRRLHYVPAVSIKPLTVQHPSTPSTGPTKADKATTPGSTPGRPTTASVPRFQVNFGSKPFAFPPPEFMPFDVTQDAEVMTLYTTTACLVPPEQTDLAAGGLTKAAFVQNLQYERPKGWSKFPPKVHEGASAAMTIQRAYRRHMLKKRLSRHKEEKARAAAVIVTAWRRYWAKKVEAAVRIQTAWRVVLARHAVRERRAVVTEFGSISRVYRAAVVISKSYQRYRTMLVRKPLVISYQHPQHVLWYNAMRIQRAWRSYVWVQKLLVLK
ncbi:hypothetical protein J8273_8850 [Carpediemonas membranifera]|uniref:Uncharacterized protein n=1 Tax=Carpediemonas membranifera TaxID=201153 RepID=A0A8J6E0N1_9EUKA|nr:hypothetical protein J8273_8850 [Carpediemonas membranifera]|eukprot:KAG9389557.1 hypothetical protein J8273_8850 [Carpediemonas membranifera]